MIKKLSKIIIVYFKVMMNTSYYLNPDLVKSNASITLFSRYFKDPLSYSCSIISSYDHRRIDNLPNLNFITKNTFSLVRMLSQTIYLSSKICSVHIKFDSNSPQVYTNSMLEALDKNCIH